jgi:LacI family transcriptional regulator
LPFDENMILKVEDIENCEPKIQKFIAEYSPDAVFAVNELFAVISIKASHKLGFKVPDDISVIAFTDGIISMYSTPTITTVSQDGIKMGRKAAMMLIDRLESDEDEEEETYTTEVIETHLIERESTR